jgi:hypothetical protein
MERFFQQRFADRSKIRVLLAHRYRCTGSDTIAIAGKDCMEGLFVPNAFTPNGDGKNDVFRPLIFGNVTSFTFAIYNRWGGWYMKPMIPHPVGMAK